MGYLCLCGGKNLSKCICCLIAPRGTRSTERCQGNARSQRHSSATRSWRMSGSESTGRPCHRWAAGSSPPPSHRKTATQGAAAAREGHPPAPSAANPGSKGNVEEQRPSRRAQRQARRAHTCVCTGGPGACAAQSEHRNLKMKPASTPCHYSPCQENACQQCKWEI